MFCHSRLQGCSFNIDIGADSYATAVLPVATILCCFTPHADLLLSEAKLEVSCFGKDNTPYRYEELSHSNSSGQGFDQLDRTCVHET